MNTSSTDSGSVIDQWMSRLRHYLPTQGPIKDFVHHNTLHAFQEYGFEEGVAKAAAQFSARRFLPLEEYFKMLDDRRIDLQAVHRVLKSHPALGPDFLQDIETRNRLSRYRFQPVSHPRMRAEWDARIHDSLDSYVHPLLFRLVSQYLDQGIAAWSLPGSNELSFFECVRDIVARSRIPIVPLSDAEVFSLLQMTADDAIQKCLKVLVLDESSCENYCWETLFSSKGWSGLISEIELSPDALIYRRNITLRDFLAVKLLLELGNLRRLLGDEMSPVASVKPLSLNIFDVSLESILQRSLEESFYQRSLSEITLQPERPVPLSSVRAQLFFCIDDRECSIRRYIEYKRPDIETYGTAGFFGVDAFIDKNWEHHLIKSCPVPVQPKHAIREIRKDSASDQRSWEVYHWLDSVHGKKAFSFAGLKAGMRLAYDVLFPLSHPAAFGSDVLDPPSDVEVLFDESRSTATVRSGYTIQEQAQRVFNVLNASGLQAHLAPVIYMIGHRASSANNPYFSAYDCGACSGKPGATNARAFCKMANHPQVRGLLASQFGLKIPDATRFIPGVHDTTRDEIRFFDDQSLSTQQQGIHEEMQAHIEVALAKNAVERCLKFDLAPQAPEPLQALGHVRSRASSIFEPRPELNHATNAACVVGRRELTRGISLDRRSFLQSYEAGKDPEGSILRSILNAVVPVCGGINLEYYFSRLDPEVYGASSKLPHNVIGLMGVANGTEGDLLTGLPTQMTEMHDPIRLMLVIQQELAIVEKILVDPSPYKEWIENEWVRLFVIHPANPAEVYRFSKMNFERVKGIVV